MKFTPILSVSCCLIFASLSNANDRLETHETRIIQGWTINISKALKTSQPKKTAAAVRLLTGQLKRVVKSVPPKAVSALRTVPIWMNPQYDGISPKAEYHPSKGWLSDNNRDPKMAKAIEITNVSIFEAENRRMPDLILHELAHAYHDQVLSFDHAGIKEAFELAKQSGTYDSVKRFTGRKTITDKAYAMSNHKEYFAETTEALFGQNDFYPFNRQELQAHDPQMVIVLKRCWGVTE